MDKTTLKRNQLLINLAHDLQRLDELGRTMRMLGFMRQRESRPVLSHDVDLVVISESEIWRTAQLKLMFPIRELWRRLSGVIAFFSEEVLEAANESF